MENQPGIAVGFFSFRGLAVNSAKLHFKDKNLTLISHTFTHKI